MSRCGRWGGLRDSRPRPVSTKRVPLRRSLKARITPEVVASWRRIRQLEAEGADDYDSGQRREYLDACSELHLLLMLKPWETTPEWATHPEPPAYRQTPDRRDDWHRAYELRQALEAAARAGR